MATSPCINKVKAVRIQIWSTKLDPWACWSPPGCPGVQSCLWPVVWKPQGLILAICGCLGFSRPWPLACTRAIHSKVWSGQDEHLILSEIMFLSWKTGPLPPDRSWCLEQRIYCIFMALKVEILLPPNISYLSSEGWYESTLGPYLWKKGKQKLLEVQVANYGYARFLAFTYLLNFFCNTTFRPHFTARQQGS